MIDVAEAYGLLRISEGTKQSYIEYFNMGMTPAAAHSFHELKILGDNEEDFSRVKILANAQVNPRKRQIYTLFNNWR